MGTEIPTGGIGKKLKRKLSVRGSLDRDELSKEILIGDCVPSVFEMYNFIYEYVDEFFKDAHRSTIIEKNSKLDRQSFYK